MLNRRRRPGVLACVAVLIAAWVSARPAAQTPPTRTGFTSLTLTLSVPARSFLLLEPVPLTLTLENRTSEPILAHTALGFNEWHLEVFIHPSGSPAYRVEQLSSIMIRIGGSPVTLPPRYRQVSTEPLTVKLRQVFPTPGKYGIQAVLHGLNGDQIRSNIAGIQVIQPAGLDRLAHRFLADSGKADYFFDGPGLASDQVVYSEYESFARRYQGTPYTDYANLALGRLHESRKEIDIARTFFSNVTTRNEYASQKAAEALARLAWR